MILLFNDKYFDLVNFNQTAMKQFAEEAGIPEGTPMMFDPTLPDEDDEGNPIFAFKVDAKETTYWKGEPLKLPPGIKLEE